MNIKVMLVDDHAMFREALHHMLDRDPSIQVVGELGDGSKVVEATTELSPDVVVMDVSMPQVNGMEATRKLLASHPRVKVVALSGFNYKQFVLEMLESGVTAYVVKSAEGNQLCQAIHSAAAGQTYLCPETTDLLVRSNRKPQSAEKDGRGNRRLGRREAAVLRLLAHGKSSPQIGEELHIAASTVDVHRRNIMRKLEMHSVAELTKYAVRVGLVSI
jgi:two-component system NarL family response regulator